MEEITEKRQKKSPQLKSQGQSGSRSSTPFETTSIYCVSLFTLHNILFFSEELRILLPTATTPQPTQKQTTVSNSGDYDNKRRHNTAFFLLYMS